MNINEIKNLAEEKTPKVTVIEHAEYYRHDLLKILDGENYIGIELGVAGGHYSERMMRSGKFKKFYGVDLYEDHHNVSEYISALKLIGLDKNYVLLRMSFDEAIELFDDGYFDFIYFDGYAHTGEEGGKTFNDWFKKLKVGGVFAGDDYHDDWPLVKWAVNDMISQLGCDLQVTGKREDTNLNWYPSWFFQKHANADFTTDSELLSLGKVIRNETRAATNKQVSISKDQLFSLIQLYIDKAPAHRVELLDLIDRDLKTQESPDNIQKNLTCAVITPVGPGHEESWYKLCLPSIEHAISSNSGAFTQIKPMPVFDTAGELGRSRARNMGVAQALAEDFDWIFFLDADDLMFGDAFEAVQPYLKDYVGVWGNIVETQFPELSEIKLRENQVTPIKDFKTLISADPFLSLQMGHFVKTEVALANPFDEQMNAGEDFKYHLQVWKANSCIKCEEVFFVNVRGNHSLGPKGANGQDWSLAVRELFSSERESLGGEIL
jgi:hypothetical protein